MYKKHPPGRIGLLEKSENSIIGVLLAVALIIIGAVAAAATRTLNSLSAPPAGRLRPGGLALAGLTGSNEMLPAGRSAPLGFGRKAAGHFGGGGRFDRNQ